jgi:hypothetical protein
MRPLRVKLGRCPDIGLVSVTALMSASTPIPSVRRERHVVKTSGHVVIMDGRIWGARRVTSVNNLPFRAKCTRRPTPDTLNALIGE